MTRAGGHDERGARHESNEHSQESFMPEEQSPFRTFTPEPDGV